MHWWVWVILGIAIIAWPWLAIRGIYLLVSRGAKQEDELTRHPSLRKYGIYQTICMVIYLVAMLIGQRSGHDFPPTLVAVMLAAVAVSILMSILGNRERRRLGRQDSEPGNVVEMRK